MESIVNEPNQATDWQPRLNAAVTETPEAIVLTGKNSEMDFLTSLNREHAKEFLLSLDGKRTTEQISDDHGSVSGADAKRIILELDKFGLLDDVSTPKARSGVDVLLEIEDLTNKILYETLYKNVFWKGCKAATQIDDVPINVMRGLVIENYHFLFRESYFDAPVLSFVGNTSARLAMNAFFAEEYGHDELLLKSLNSVGLTREDVFDLQPLPETMALINALAYWAHNDPIFFFTTLGVLEGKDIKEDSFIAAAERMGLEKSFIGPVKAHSNLNLDGEHGNLTREIFNCIPVIDEETVRRLRAQTPLFIELYDNFFTAIWEHYSNTSDLLERKLSAL